MVYSAAVNLFSENISTIHQTQSSVQRW